MPKIKRKPYNPAKAGPQVHDRRAIDMSVGVKNHLAPIDVDDPFEVAAKITVMRSTRDDPLGDLHARNMIDEAQYQAGRAFQSDWERAERGPRAIDPSKEAVDGGMMPEPITEAQRRSGLMLKRAHKALGQDGSSVVHDVLVHCKTAAQIALSRGFVGRQWADHFSNEFKFRLNQLAFCYGFSNVAPRR